MFSTLYDFCRDQGSIIGGLLALAAGYLVFRGTTRTANRQVAAANAQTEALRQQNRDLRNEGQRRQGRDGIVATKLLASVLGIIINDVDKLKELLDHPRYTGTNRIVPTNYRQLLYKPPLNIVWDDLGMCSPDLVGKYLQLDAKLSEFARSQVYAVDIMQNELRVIADILVLLDQELQSDAARHNKADRGAARKARMRNRMAEFDHIRLCHRQEPTLTPPASIVRRRSLLPLTAIRRCTVHDNLLTSRRRSPTRP